MFVIPMSKKSTQVRPPASARQVNHSASNGWYLGDAIPRSGVSRSTKNHQPSHARNALSARSPRIRKRATTSLHGIHQTGKASYQGAWGDLTKMARQRPTNAAREAGPPVHLPCKGRSENQPKRKHRQNGPSMRQVPRKRNQTPQVATNVGRRRRRKQRQSSNHAAEPNRS